MGPRFPDVRTLLCVGLIAFPLQVVIAQTSYIGRCQVSSTPLQVRSEGLAERVGGLDASHDWEKLLSVGEQQRLG